MGEVNPAYRAPASGPCTEGFPGSVEATDRRTQASCVHRLASDLQPRDDGQAWGQAALAWDVNFPGSSSHLFHQMPTWGSMGAAGEGRGVLGAETRLQASLGHQVFISPPAKCSPHPGEQHSCAQWVSTSCHTFSYPFLYLFFSF